MGMVVVCCVLPLAAAVCWPSLPSRILAWPHLYRNLLAKILWSSIQPVSQTLTVSCPTQAKAYVALRICKCSCDCVHFWVVGKFASVNRKNKAVLPGDKLMIRWLPVLFVVSMSNAQNYFCFVLLVAKTKKKYSKSVIAYFFKLQTLELLNSG